jgi:hypothetical protein
MSKIACWYICCNRCTILSISLEKNKLIVLEQSMWHPFVGVDHNLNVIIVAIRGTQENRPCNNCQVLLPTFSLSCKHIFPLNSIQDWIKDLIWKQVDLNYPNLHNAKVSSLAYNSTLFLREWNALLFRSFSDAISNLVQGPHWILLLL